MGRGGLEIRKPRNPKRFSRSYLTLAYRIHETVAEEHAHEHHRHGRVLDNGGEGHPTSVDMLMSLFDHLDLGAIMHHLSEEDADEVENTDQEDLTTAESTSTIQGINGAKAFGIVLQLKCTS